MNVGIIGVTGYGGGELARLMSTHPAAKLAYVSSESSAGRPLSDPLPNLMGRTTLACEPFHIGRALDTCDVLFAAQESGWASRYAAEIVGAGKTLIDLSADFRLRDPSVYQAWYKLEAPPVALSKSAVYGLPELFRDKIAGARLIANPGCYPTAAALALAPAIGAGLVDESAIVINSLSGVSGAGRSKQTLQYHFPELNENAAAYGVGGSHRHTPEIEQTLSCVAGREVRITFTPHLVPITRGILTTAVAPLAPTADEAAVREAFEAAYADEPFVHLLPAGRLPATKETQGANNALVALAVDRRLGRLTVVCALDNLIKGAAGQAIQNMNIACGFDETAGLMAPGMYP